MNHIFSSILGGFLKEGFLPEMVSMTDSIVKATIDIYSRISAELLPTPARSHYTFNLRDVSKVFQGILMITPGKCSTKDDLIKLWVHENLRVFHDRLINVEDKQWFKDLVVELLNRHTTTSLTSEDLFDNPLIFGDWIRPGLEDPKYEELNDMGRVTKVLDEYMESYNLEHTNQMSLVFFESAAEHVARIVRILRQPRGNAMLVGVGGSGRQSLTRLAAFIVEAKCSQIELTRGYSSNEFREDLKQLYIGAGVEGEKQVFLFTDTQIVNETFLEDINNILNTGEVPNLFPQDELDKVIADMFPVVKALGIPESRDNCYNTFISRVRENLHISLCMSPVGEQLRVYCRQFPSLINCCTIDWFLPWPEEALRTVASRFLAEVEMPSDEIKQAVIDSCVIVHTSVGEDAERFMNELRRKTYITPKSYLDLIALYLDMLTEKRMELEKIKSRMVTGCDKLNETNEMVENLREELKAMQPVLEKKTVETEDLLKQVAIEQEDAAEVQQRVSAEEEIVAEKTTEVSAIQADAQKDLDVAMPALEKSVKALKGLDKKDITEMKSFSKPPQAVVTVMEAVLILLGEKTDWDNAKKVMGDTNFIKRLQDFNRDKIPSSRLKKLKKYIKNPNMAVANVQKVSKAATSLAMWVHAMDIYSKVAKEVEPKRKRLNEMNKQLSAQNAELAEKQGELQKVLDKVAELQAQCDATVDEKNRLLSETQVTKARLVRAEKLTSGLSTEGTRWNATVTELSANIENLIGDIFFSAACISYYGPFTGTFRNDLIKRWHSFALEKGIPCSSEFSLSKIMGSPVQIREWQINGLPSDSVSVDSAILVTRGKRWPLMIDPQGQAVKWIKNVEAGMNLECTKMSDPNMLRSMENAIRVGRPVLMEDLGETLDPSLEPVLCKRVFKQSGRLLIRLGDSDVDYDPSFRFYMTTKMPNPHFLPEVCIKVTVINFTVTMEGLNEQLLGNVVKKERPDIEEKRNSLVVSMAADRRQLKEIEDKILRLLSESKGNILDDEELINTLAHAKVTSGIISERVAESEKTAAEVQLMRDQYQPVSKWGAVLYFVIADLAHIDPMYQYSLDFFIRLFDRCIDEAERCTELVDRLKAIIDFQTVFIFQNVSRGLFAKHKLLFAFLITSNVMLQDGDILPLEWVTLLKGTGVTNVKPKDNPMPDVLSDKSWEMVSFISSEVQLGHHQVLSKDNNNNNDNNGDDKEENSNDRDDYDKINGESQEMEEPKELVNEENNVPKTNDTKMNTLPDFDIHVIEHVDTWKQWMHDDEVFKNPLPEPFESNLTTFQKLLVLKCFREDVLLMGISKFVADNLGHQFVRALTTSMVDIHGDMSPSVPCIFVLSTGADPTSMLLRFAKEKGFDEKLKVISLGQGQGPRAERLIEEASMNGDWVLLQNCHLAKSWMPRLEQVVLGNMAKELHNDFRLFLTSFPASYFPVAVLQNGIKMTTEPPKGLRSNMIRSYDMMMTPDVFNGCSKDESFKKLCMGLTFFHGLLQERRKFGPLGWNIRYEFNDSDLETSLSVLKMFLEEQDHVPWDALRFVTGEINYGGRVTDDWDRRCLRSVLNHICTPSLFEEDYKFSQSGVYRLPIEHSLDDHKNYLQSLPLQEDPEVFGMDPNAAITFQMQEVTSLLHAAIQLSPQSANAVGGGGKSADDVVLELATLLESELPNVLTHEEAGAETFIIHPNGLMDSLSTVLLQEMTKFNRLLVQMKISLRDVQKAVKGMVVMSVDLDKMYTSFLLNQVPELWSRVAYPSLKPLGSWTKDLYARVAFMRDWLQNGKPLVFPLNTFFFPQGFMTGALQVHARKFAIPINSLDFQFTIYDKFADELTEADLTSNDGVVLSGLWMEGARWDREKSILTESLPSVIYDSMPPIHFLPVAGHEPNPDDYQCPVYKTSHRAGELSTTGMSTNFVVAVELPTNKSTHHWIWRGTAFLLNLND
eukprot:TRINITY_DN1630_c1_g5_i3.p1 TRINITY_DN1630_c1_g5~~TRINITY_DN1630_c1_g5_i3.p1  ORF type:complete len:1943 (+),score=485.57 TRINITY_DN1630_c1_g5_i3:173-6001(+)